MPEAIVIHDYGNSEVLRLEQVTVPAPDPGCITIRQTAIGVNFHDVYVRSGLYKTLTPPGILGCEGTGSVDAIGPDVEGFAIGDRVAYVTGPPYGAYASHRMLPAHAAMRLPDTISDALAGSAFLRGLTVNMLVHKVHALQPGMTILVHAAAGGVGRLMCQWASRLGVTVLGTVGSQEKADIAKASGCAHPILYRETPFDQEALALTQGKGVDVVYDSIGADTFVGSMTALAACGHLVNFGQSSGPVDPVAMSTLAEKSLTITRPILFHYISDKSAYQNMADSVFRAFADGTLHQDSPQSIPLADAKTAHDILESRQANTGIILTP